MRDGTAQHSASKANVFHRGQIKRGAVIHDTRLLTMLGLAIFILSWLVVNMPSATPSRFHSIYLRLPAIKMHNDEDREMIEIRRDDALINASSRKSHAGDGGATR